MPDPLHLPLADGFHAPVLYNSPEKQTKNGKAVSPPPDNKESGDLSPEHRVHQWVHREPMVYE